MVSIIWTPSAERQAVDIRIRAEREAGKMMRDMEKKPGSNGSNYRSDHAEPSGQSEYAQAKKSANISDTLDEFSRTVPRGTVQTDTQSYSRVHNAVMDGQGLGRVFLEHVLQGKSSKRKDNIKVLADNCGSRGFSLFFLL